MRRQLLSTARCVPIAKQTTGILMAIASIGLLVPVPGANTPAQSPVSTTWAVSIVLPSRVISGQPATLAVLGVDGRLAEGITVNIGNDQRVKTDKSGRALFTAPSGTSVMIATAAGNSAAALVDSAPPLTGAQAPVVAPVVSQLDQFSICGGGFRGDADANHLTLNDERAFVLAASPECLAVLASPRALPGPAKISIETPDVHRTTTTTLVSLHFDPPLPPLVPNKRSKLVLHVQGSEQALRVLAENRTPGVLRFLRGDRQELVTSGGSQNSAEVAVQHQREPECDDGLERDGHSGERERALVEDAQEARRAAAVLNIGPPVLRDGRHIKAVALGDERRLGWREAIKGAIAVEVGPIVAAAIGSLRGAHAGRRGDIKKSVSHRLMSRDVRPELAFFLKHSVFHPIQ